MRAFLSADFFSHPAKRRAPRAASVEGAAAAETPRKRRSFHILRGEARGHAQTCVEPREEPHEGDPVGRGAGGV